jgi:hypothetical protein
MPPERDAARLWVSRGLALLALVVVLGLPIAALWWDVWAGVLGLLLAVAFLLTASFERACRFSEDALAAKAVGDPRAVASIVESVDWEGIPPASYADLPGGSGSARRVVDRICRLLSPAPLTKERLDRLSGARRARSAVATAALSAEKVFAAISGTRHRAAPALGQMASIGFYQAAGGMAGLLTVAALFLLLRWEACNYVSFIVTIAVLGAGVGVVLAERVARAGTSAVMFTWAAAGTSVFSTSVGMLGLSLTGSGVLTFLALLLPVAFVVAAVCTFMTGAVYLRLRALVKRLGPPGPGEAAEGPSP